MGHAPGKTRSAPEALRSLPSDELRSLGHMQAPWFFEAELQRRLRTGDRGPRQPIRSALWIASLVVVLTALTVVAYVEFGDRLNDLLPGPSAPAITPPDTASVSHPDTMQAAHPETVAVLPRSIPSAGVRRTVDTLRPPVERGDVLDTSSRPSQVTHPAVQETSRTDTFRRPESTPSVVPKDTSLPSSDSLGRHQGAP